MKYVLAPLAGFTNAPFRRLCSHRGVDLTVTEMVSAAGLAHGSSPTRHLMEVLPGEGPVAVQLFGSHPDELAAAAHEADSLQRFAAIDVNAGCPMPKIMREGAGAALLRDPQKIHDCLKAIVSETKLPVTLKTRPGMRPDRVNLFEILNAAEQAGAQGITLHARFTSQAHGGPVWLDLLGELVQKTRLPVTGNGGVVDRTTANEMAATGVAAIMIGRAALGDPDIFEELKSPSAAAQTKEELLARKDAAFREHLTALLEFREQLENKFPNDHVPCVDGYISVAMHTFLFRYFNGRPGAAQMRRTLNTVRTLSEVLDAARACGVTDI